MMVRGRLRTFLPAPSAMRDRHNAAAQAPLPRCRQGSRRRTQFGFGLLAVLAGFFLALADGVDLGFVAAFDCAAASASLGGAGGAVVVTAAGSDGGGGSKLAPRPGHNSIRGVMPAMVLP